MCWLFNACTFKQVMELLVLLVFGGGVFMLLPLALVFALYKIEKEKVKSSGIDVNAIINDARRRAYERGYDDPLDNSHGRSR